MRKPRVYLDTSVIGGCLDEEFAEDSLARMDMARRGELTLLVSDVLLDELEDAPSEVGAVLDSIPPEHVEIVRRTDEVLQLRDKYLSSEILGAKWADDTLHVAYATIAKADLLVSWNFKHIVHYDKVRKFNGVNLSEGYTILDIRTPTEVMTQDENENF